MDGKMSFNNNPIGVFDSGLGGLTVVKELIRQLPQERIVYYGDTARVPYGSKSRESIIRFSQENTAILLKHHVKMIVVACNTSSSYALAVLRKKFPLPVVGVIEPGARKAAAATRNRRVGVIATPATVNSGSYARAIGRCRRGIKVFSQACPLFVPLVEEGWMHKPVTLEVAREYLGPLRQSGIDALVLGCTHYPLLKGVLQAIMGKGVVLVDSAREVACEVKRILEARRLLGLSGGKPKHEFLISDRPQEFGKIAKNFLGYDIKVTKI